MTDALARTKTKGTRQSVSDLPGAHRIIDGLAQGALRTASDVAVDGSKQIMGYEGQEILASRILIGLPNNDARERVIMSAKQGGK